MDVLKAGGGQTSRGMGTSNGVSGKAVKLWIDCDAGVDDAQAICLALAAPEVELIGISTVHGNVVGTPGRLGACMQLFVPDQLSTLCMLTSRALLRAQEVAKVVKNVARVLQVTRRLDVPFYLGSDEPLIGKPIDAAFFHGQDGLGDVPHAHPALDTIAHSPLQGIAALKLIQARLSHGWLLPSPRMLLPPVSRTLHTRDPHSMAFKASVVGIKGCACRAASAWRHRAAGTCTMLGRQARSPETRLLSWRSNARRRPRSTRGSWWWRRWGR